MSLARISLARQLIVQLAADVPGLDPSRVKLGIVDVGVGDNVFLDLDSQPPLSIALAGTTATATFDSPPVFAVDQLVTVACPALDVIATGLSGVQRITAIDASANTITWTIPQTSAQTVTPAPEDLIFTTPYLLVKAAENLSADCDSGIAKTAIQCLMYFGFLADADQTYVQFETIAFALRDALMDSDNWDGLCIGPSDVKVSTPQLLRKDKPLTGLYTISAEFSGL